MQINDPSFIKNKYLKWYILIIENAKNENRIYDSSIHEMHHCVPKSFGGDESQENYIPLTFKEHYICHLLLTKFTEGKFKMKMCFALHTFFHFDLNRNLNISRGKLYEYHKNLFKEMCKEREHRYSKEVFHFKNVDTNEEFIGTRNEFMRISGLSSQDVYMLIRRNSKMFYIKRWGVYREQDKCFSFDKKRIRPPHPKVECEHCNKKISNANYTRFHGKKCKEFDPIAYNNATEQIRNINRNKNVK